MAESNVVERVARLEEKYDQHDADIARLEDMYVQLSKDIKDMKAEMGAKVDTINANLTTVTTKALDSAPEWVMREVKLTTRMNSFLWMAVIIFAGLAGFHFIAH